MAVTPHCTDGEAKAQRGRGRLGGSHSLTLQTGFGLSKPEAHPRQLLTAPSPGLLCMNAEEGGQDLEAQGPRLPTK